jgi:cytosolic phospholipase A2
MKHEITSPLAQYLLSGLIRKVTAPLGIASLTDIYGSLVSARLLVPSDLSKLNQMNLSLHQIRRFVDNGMMPMPIMTAISRRLPEPLDDEKIKVAEEIKTSVDESKLSELRERGDKIEKQASWLCVSFAFWFCISLICPSSSAGCKWWHRSRSRRVN